MFSNGSSSSISLLTVTPSLVTVGPPKDLLMITLRPVGPMRDGHGVGQLVDAREHLGPGGVVEHELLWPRFGFLMLNCDLLVCQWSVVSWQS